MGCLKLPTYQTVELDYLRSKICLTSCKSEKTACRSYLYGFNGQEKDNEIKGAGNSYDFGARMLDVRLGRWLSIDPKTTSYPSLSPYSYAVNTPISAVDNGGKDVYLVVWFPHGSNVGHTAIVVDKYKSVERKIIENGVERTIIENVKDGFYYFDLWPLETIKGTKLDQNVKPDFQIKELDDIKAFEEKDPSASGIIGQVNQFGEGRPPDAIIKINTTKNQDVVVFDKLLDIIDVDAYNACSNNCSTFGETVIKSVVPGFNAEEQIDFPLLLNVLGIKNTKASTPNSIYKAAKKLPNVEIKKFPKPNKIKKIETQSFTEMAREERKMEKKRSAKPAKSK